VTIEEVTLELKRVGIVLGKHDGLKDNNDGTWALLLSIDNPSFSEFWKQFDATVFEQVHYAHTMTERFMQFRLKV